MKRWILFLLMILGLVFIAGAANPPTDNDAWVNETRDTILGWLYFKANETPTNYTGHATIYSLNDTDNITKMYVQWSDGTEIEIGAGGSSGDFLPRNGSLPMAGPLVMPGENATVYGDVASFDYYAWARSSLTDYMTLTGGPLLSGPALRLADMNLVIDGDTGPTTFKGIVIGKGGTTGNRTILFNYTNNEKLVYDYEADDFTFSRPLYINNSRVCHENDPCSAGGGHSHNQDLNTTNDVLFSDITMGSSLEQGTLKMEAFTFTMPLGRTSSQIYWENPNGFTGGYNFVNTNNQFTWHSAAQSAAGQVGNAWVDFDNGDASFNDLTIETMSIRKTSGTVPAIDFSNQYAGNTVTGKLDFEGQLDPGGNQRTGGISMGWENNTNGKEIGKFEVSINMLGEGEQTIVYASPTHTNITAGNITFKVNRTGAYMHNGTCWLGWGETTC